MAKIQANFADIKTGFADIPPGDYRVRVESVEEIKSKDGNPGLKFTLEIDDPDHTDLNGQRIWDSVYLLKKDGKQNDVSLGRVKSYAEAILGEDESDGDEIDTEEFIGETCIVTVFTETYKKEGGGEGSSTRVKRVTAE